MPSVNSSSSPKVWPSSTLTTPSLPTFSIASAMTSPISRSRAEMVATRAMSSLPEISFACDVVRRRGDLANELGALVLEDVFDLDLTRDRDAVVRDRRRAELLVQHDITTLGAKCDLDRVSEDVHAALESTPRVLVELQLFMSHSDSPCVPVVRVGEGLPSLRRLRLPAPSSSSSSDRTSRPWPGHPTRGGLGTRRDRA